MKTGGTAEATGSSPLSTAVLWLGAWGLGLVCLASFQGPSMVRAGMAWDAGIWKHGLRKGTVSPLHRTATVLSHHTESQVPRDLDDRVEFQAPPSCGKSPLSLWQPAPRVPWQADMGLSSWSSDYAPSQRRPSGRPELCVTCKACQGTAVLTAFGCGLRLERVLPISSVS